MWKCRWKLKVETTNDKKNVREKEIGKDSLYKDATQRGE